MPRPVRVPWRPLALLLLILPAVLVPTVARSQPPSKPIAAQTLPGFVIHFDFLNNEREARDLVQRAAELGARVLNIVPPAHVWKDSLSLRMLDQIVADAAARHMAIVFTRIDAAYPPKGNRERFNYLYGRILTRLGTMPDGKDTIRFFRATAGRPGYAKWMEQETRFYAKRYGRLPNLLGINLGPFSEPFASQRGGFLQFDEGTGRYELTQYTPEARGLWHEWLRRHYRRVDRVNREYETRFHSFDDIPLPLNEKDARFGRGLRAYYDFARTLNDWFVERYERCRRIWHETSGRADVPFLLQLSGFEPEKLGKAGPGAAAFDYPGWIEMADAIGLSLYANDGYDDYGHAAISATITLVARTRERGKDVFVVESGCEAPNVVADRAQLDWLAQVARPLSPRVFVYEFLKDRFDEDYAENPGKPVRADGTLRPEAVAAVQEMLARATTVGVEPPPSPRMQVVVDRLAAREDIRVANALLALMDVVGIMPVRFVRAGSAAADTGSGLPTARLTLPLERTPLTELLLRVPPPGTDARTQWFRELADMFR